MSDRSRYRRYRYPGGAKILATVSLTGTVPISRFGSDNGKEKASYPGRDHRPYQLRDDEHRHIARCDTREAVAKLRAMVMAGLAKLVDDVNQ